MGKALSELVEALQKENNFLKGENENLKDKVQELQIKLAERPKKNPYDEDGAYEKVCKENVYLRTDLWKLAVEYLKETGVLSNHDW